VKETKQLMQTLSATKACADRALWEIDSTAVKYFNLTEPSQLEFRVELYKGLPLGGH
jgi:hypothetical protein